MGREVLRTAGLTVEDAQFIPAATAGRLPGLVAGQIDGVALHPEDVYLAKKQKPTLNLLVQLAELMPDYMFNAYGASLDWIARDRALLRDTAAAMIEANRAAYRDKAKVVPIIVKATEKPKDAVEYAIDVLTKNCVWSVNGGLDPKRTAWTIENSVENGDVEKDKKPSAEQVANFALAGKRSKPPAARSPSAIASVTKADALHEHPDGRPRISLGAGAHAPRPECAVLQHVRHALLPGRGLRPLLPAGLCPPLRRAARRCASTSSTA